MKRFTLLALCAAFVLALGLVTACGSSGTASSSANQTSSASATTAPASSASDQASSSESSSTSSSAAEASTSSASTSSAESSSASVSEGEGFDFVDDCIDEHGNITLYALTELKGWQVATLLDQQGYKFDEVKNMWLRQEDGASFSAYRHSGIYTLDTYNEMNEKGGAIAALGFNTVAGYKDAQEALKGNAKCVVEDSYFNGDDGVVIFYGPSMKEYLAIVSATGENITQFEIFSQEAIGSGMFDEAMGEQVGGTIGDVWTALTGKETYGH